MKTTHTPGLWHVGTHRGKPDYELILDKSDRVVCQMYDRFEDYFTNYQANAKLIAVAPELLKNEVENLEFLRWIATQLRHFNMMSDKRELLYDRIATTEAAIKKATE